MDVDVTRVGVTIGVCNGFRRDPIRFFAHYRVQIARRTLNGKAEFCRVIVSQVVSDKA
jgi:hypothetical protein